MRRLDVTDFATPVFTVDALRANQDARLVVTAAAEYDQVAYQTDNQFTLELKPPVAAGRGDARCVRRGSRVHAASGSR